MLEKTDSLIFDLDGTLWDATATVARAWNVAREQVGFEIQHITQEDIRSVAGMQHNLIYDKFFPQLTDEQRKELMEISGREEMEHLKRYGGSLFDGMQDALEYLHGKYALFIVSNCQDGYIEAFYDFNKLSHLFKDHECSGRTGNPKHENLIDIIRRNSLKHPVYVGDTNGDYEASAKAGVPFVYAAYGFGNVPRYDLHLNSPADLKKVFLNGMIVKATPDDIDELFALWQELMQQHQHYHKVFKCRPNQQQALKAELLNRLKERDTQVFVYEQDGEWLGMIICQIRKSIAGFELSRKGYIAETVVTKDQRGRSIGKELFEAASNWLQDNGADHLELQVSVKNTAAIEFWQSRGFTPTTHHMVLVLDR